MDMTPDELAELPALRSFTHDDLAELISLSKVVNLKADMVIMEPGTVADTAMLLVSGRLTVSVEGDGGRERGVGDVWPGEIVGESAFFPGITVRTARVRVTAPGKALVLPSTLLEDSRGSRALLVLQTQLMATLARRIRATDVAVRKAWQDQVEAQRRQDERQHAQLEESLTLGQRLLSIFGVRT